MRIYSFRILFTILCILSTSTIHTEEAQEANEIISENCLNPSPTYVTCELDGGLANQLFEIATTLAYAWDYGATPIFPDLRCKYMHVPLYAHSIFFRLDRGPSNANEIFKTQYTLMNPYDPTPIPFSENIKLKGYFQVRERFYHHRDKLLKMFAPSERMVQKLEQKYSSLLANPNTVGVHVRTYNNHYHNTHPICFFIGLEYYQNAMDIFPPDTVFVIFSDRINWCKKHFPELGKSYIFIEGNNAVEDLFLLSMMKHQIVGTSTFGWWGAFLNQNPEKLVIVPDGHPGTKLLGKVNYHLPGSIECPANLRGPYPSDMTHYDINAWDGN